MLKNMEILKSINVLIGLSPVFFVVNLLKKIQFIEPTPTRRNNDEGYDSESENGKNGKNKNSRKNKKIGSANTDTSGVNFTKLFFHWQQYQKARSFIELRKITLYM